jgi:hypothetical protein
MRVLATVHQGNIRTVMTPMLIKAGHEAVGYDTNLTFDAGGSITRTPALEKDTRDIEGDDLEGLEAMIHLAACPIIPSATSILQ